MNSREFKDGEPYPVPIYFKGDDRGPSADLGASSRGMQFVWLAQDCTTGDLSEKPGSQRNDETRSYAWDAVVNDGRIGPEDDDRVRHDCVLWHDAAYAGTGTFTKRVLTTGRIAGIDLSGSPSDPLIPGSPSIDWNIRMRIERPEGGSTIYSVNGTHDGYPDQELYINGQQVYHHHGTDINSLWGCCDKSINISGTLPSR